MVRFARIKGVHVKSSFNKVPEEASTWEELQKAASADADEDFEHENTNNISRNESLPKKVEGAWSEFEPETTASKKKKRQKKSSKIELDTEQPKKKKAQIQQRNAFEGTWSEFEPETTESKKKKKKNQFSEFESVTEQPKKNKSKNQYGVHPQLIQTTGPQTDGGDILMKNRNKCKEAKSEKFDLYSMTDEERAKKLQELRKQLREQGKDEKDIFGLNELEKWEAETTEPTKKNWNKKFGEFESETEHTKKKSKIPYGDEPQLIQSTDPQTQDKDVVMKTEKIANVPPKKKSRKEKELEGLDFKRRKPDSAESVLCIDGKEVKLEKFDGYLMSEERAKRLQELSQQLREEGKDEKDIFGLLKLERRKAEKELKSWKKRMCFHCRKGGHNLSDCPELSNKPEQGSGICFKCGSTEHKLYQCKSKSKTLEYATCFICNAKGHLSRECTNNPRGLYPDGGGCKTCGDVTHYERDCPKKRAHKKEVVSAKRIVFDDVEALDYDDEIVSPKKALKTDGGKRPNKIIKFA